VLEGDTRLPVALTHAMRGAAEQANVYEDDADAEGGGEPLGIPMRLEIERQHGRDQAAKRNRDEAAKRNREADQEESEAAV
jgi:hypothetical protein